MSTNIERQELTVNQFIWKENGFAIPAGKLLFILNTLSRSQLESNYIGDPEVVSYLTSLNMIDTISPNQYKLKEGMERSCIGLGNKISHAVGTELRNLPIGTEVSCPKIHSIKQLTPEPKKKTK